MKKMIKKLGVLILIMALISPYVYIPEVKAETTNSCERKLKTYMFVDASSLLANVRDINGKQEKMSWVEYYAIDNKGYNTNTEIPFTFSDLENETVEIMKVELNNLENDEELKKYWSIYFENIGKVSKKELIEDVGTSNVYFYELEENAPYTENEVVFHGKWSNDDENLISNGIINYDSTTAYKYSIQNVFPNDKLKISVKSASTSDGESIIGGTEDFDGNYMTHLVKGERESNTYVKNNQKYFYINVNRKLEYDSDWTKNKQAIRDELNKMVFVKTATDKSGNKWVYLDGGDNTSKISDLTTVANSYQGMIDGEYKIYDGTGEPTGTNVINLDHSYFWPAVLTVDYKVCRTDNSVSPETPGKDKFWDVEYTAKTEDVGNVSNLPSKHTQKLGEPSQVATGIPVKDEYVFTGWCVGTETCTKVVKAGETLTSPSKEGTVTLYAQWGKSGPEDQVKTGVVSYVLGLSAVALIAGGIYLVSKKKNLFSQI